MMQLLKTDMNTISLLFDRRGANDMIGALDSLLGENILRVDIHIDYSNLRKQPELIKSHERTLSIVKTDLDFEQLFTWTSSTVLMVLNEESIDYLYFKLKEYLETGFVFPTDVLDLYSSNMKQQVSFSIIPLEN